MARPLRIQFENAHYHVTCRGNARQEIYATDADRSTFLDLLGRSADIYQVAILAYVLMRNHFHLLVKTPKGNLQEFMRHFNISYTVYFNRRHRRSGHLYQGRYKSFLIDADNYLKEVSRYIHLNPIRIKKTERSDAEVVDKALRLYPWSSYPGYVSSRARKSYLRVEGILSYFGGDNAAGRRGYARYVEQGLGIAIENPLELGRGHGIIGDRGFVDAVRDRYLPSAVNVRELPALERIRGRLEPERIVAAVCTVLKVKRAELFAKGSRAVGRGLLMELLHRQGGMKQPEIGEMMGIDYSTVSVGRKRFLIKMESDAGLRALLTAVQKQINQG